jgi:hypothetical protein
MGMQEGDVDPAPDAEVTGIAMAAVLDDVITQGDANTGIITDIAWGEKLGVNRLGVMVNILMLQDMHKLQP